MSTKKKKLNAGLNNSFSSNTPPENTKEETPPPVVAKPPEPPAVEAVAEPVAVSDTKTVEKVEAPKEATSIAKDKTMAPKNKDADDTDLYDDDEQQIVVFKLADESYGIDISMVESIIKMQAMTLVPHAYHYVEGVTNLRGTVVPVIDLRTRFGMPRIEETKETRIIVVEQEKSMVGVVVDAVIEVLRISPKIIEPPSMFVATLDAAYISGIAKFDERLITLLDLDKIFVVHDTLEV